ncbi:site-specific DNA-methyltransferase, partial [Phocaeicola sp.]|uniref:site-specific DNA-methyltransferase n=1 Tax=Phocaeicola sp. TaxID=2773926 RepID=UPI003AB21832
MKPNKLGLNSVDGTQLNLEALYQIAPSCFTEVKDDKTGELRHVVNFKTLRQLLGDNAVEDADEMYQFTWPGKQEARREAARPTTKTLRPVVEDSVDWDNTQNLYIEGDNLEVLKLLQKSYMGKVKMIYIDPPYNTGNDFVYDDDFARTLKDEELAAGNIDELGNRYRKNLDTNARFHSDWCSMIYARLSACRSLLTDDGVIFISIGVEELSNLKNMCNEIFGEKNF